MRVLLPNDGSRDAIGRIAGFSAPLRRCIACRCDTRRNARSIGGTHD